ncbi:13490_t:CDS:1, partial [Racocetra persica]
ASSKKSIQQPIQEPIQPIQQPIQEPIQQPIQQPIQEPIQEPIQQPIQESTQQSVAEKNHLSEPNSPLNSNGQSNMSQNDPSQAAPETANATITTTTDQPQTTTPVTTNATITTTNDQTTASASTKITINTLLNSPDTTPISSPVEMISNTRLNDGVNSNNNHFSPYSTPPPQHITLNDQFDLNPPTFDEAYASDSLDYFQSRFPPSSNAISRTQQKINLQRDSFLADDENYIIHPHNQRRLTRAIERINREHVAISLYRNPMIESLQRVFAKYAQDHPEVLDDDFGAGYEDSKEWGILSDHAKTVDQIGSAVTNSIVAADVLTTESMAFRSIK